MAGPEQPVHHESALRRIGRFITGLPGRRQAKAAQIEARSARIDLRLEQQRIERAAREAADAEREQRAAEEQARRQEEERVRAQGRAVAEAAQEHLNTLVQEALRAHNAAAVDEPELGVDVTR